MARVRPTFFRQQSIPSSYRIDVPASPSSCRCLLCSRVSLRRTGRQTIWVLFPLQGQLATITAQCNEADYPALGKSIDKIIASVVMT